MVYLNHLLAGFNIAIYCGHFWMSGLNESEKSKGNKKENQPGE